MIFLKDLLKHCYEGCITNPPWETPKGYYGIEVTQDGHTSVLTNIYNFRFIAYTSSLLKSKGHEVLAFDAVAEELNSDEFCNKINIFKPEAVFMECSTPSFEQDIVNAKKIKKLGFKVFIFGTHISAFAEKITEENKEIDGFIRGEFELIIEDIVNNINNFRNVKGLSYWDENTNKAVINEKAENIKDLDALPAPDRESFKASDYYIHLDPKPNALLVSSRGCPFQCTYCIWPQAIMETYTDLEAQKILLMKCKI